jgi:hypothetical protein
MRRLVHLSPPDTQTSALGKEADVRGISERTCGSGSVAEGRERQIVGRFATMGATPRWVGSPHSVWPTSRPKCASPPRRCCSDPPNGWLTNIRIKRTHRRCVDAIPSGVRTLALSQIWQRTAQRRVRLILALTRTDSGQARAASSRSSSSFLMFSFFPRQPTFDSGAKVVVEVIESSL